jgi:uncharacterized membrane protein YidH (DUF202 family)
MATTSFVDQMLDEVGNMHSSEILFLVFVIIGAGVLTFVIMKILNRKREKKMSDFVMFLIALNVSFFLTVVIFVYKVVIIGLKYLFGG